jgi:hypothetical protein
MADQENIGTGGMNSDSPAASRPGTSASGDGSTSGTSMSGSGSLSGSSMSGGTSSSGGISGGGLSSGTGGGTSGTHTDSGVCASCGRAMDSESGGGIEALLARIGISEEMVSNLKSSVSNIDVEQYLTTARDYLKDTGGKAKSYTKENPGKVAAGVAAVALGAGLLITALGRDKD